MPLAQLSDLLKRLAGEGFGRLLLLKLLRPVAGTLTPFYLTVTPGAEAAKPRHARETA
jgi:hypothetical protein